MTYSLYRLYGDEDALLYIGISMNLPGRLTRHRDQKAWWQSVRHVSVEYFDTRDAALVAEREAIKAERPIWNIQHNLLWPAALSASPSQSALEMLCGRVPGLDDAASRAALAGRFDIDHADDEDERGSIVDYSSWPRDLKAFVAAVEQVVDREWCASHVIHRVLQHLTRGDMAPVLAEARELFILHGDPDPPDDQLERYAIQAITCRAEPS